jgi:DNA-damage-inducible protein J
MGVFLNENATVHDSLDTQQHGICSSDSPWSKLILRFPMPAEAIIETHLDEALRQKAAAVFATAGLTIDEAFQRLILRTVEQQSVPLELFQPGAETLEAMEELRNGGGKSFTSVEALMADLNADD